METFASMVDLDKLVFGLNSRGPKMFQEEWHQVCTEESRRGWERIDIKGDVILSVFNFRGSFSLTVPI